MAISELIDARTGIVHHVVRDPPDPNLPGGWLSYSAHVGGHPVVLPWVVDRQGFGGSLGRPEVARGAAIGEAAERYAGNARALPRRHACRRDLEAASEPVAPRNLLPGFSAEQLAAPGFPFSAPHDDLTVDWVKGRWIDDESPVWVPAAAVYLNYHRDPAVHEAPVAPQVYAGIAAGRSRLEAEGAALAEVVERDAVTLWWARGLPSAAPAGVQQVLARVLDREASTRDIVLHQLPCEVGVPVCGAFVEDHRRRLVAFGTAARPTVTEAAEKALVEALGLLLLTKEVATAGSGLWRSVQAGLIPATTFFAFRKDRRYRQDAGPNWERLTDLPGLIQLYLDPSMQGRPLDRLRDPVASPGDLPGDLPDEDRRAAMHGAITAHGYRAISVDLTTPDIAAGGLTVVRVLVPGLYGNPPAAYLPLGTGRLLAPRTADGPALRPADLHPDPLLLA